MGEMLSFLGSKSASYVLREEGRVSRPDENYAREIMQLFTIGLYKLKKTGQVDMKNGVPIPTYSNDDIQTFARGWTGKLFFVSNVQIKVKNLIIHCFAFSKRFQVE